MSRKQNDRGGEQVAGRALPSLNRGVLEVSGQRDEVIASLRKVKTASGRRKERRYMVEGAELCRRALTYGATLEALICTRGFAESEEGVALRASLPTNCTAYVAHQGLIAKALEAKPTPECVGLARLEEREWSELISAERVARGGLWVGVDEGELADNLGMLLRSAEASGVEGVLLGNGTVDPFGRKVVRGSRGAVFHLKLAVERDMLSAVREARARGIQVVTTSANTDVSYTTVDFTKPTLLIVGNEHRGVSEALIEESDLCVKIPMMGQINSLNIAVAASVTLFEASRQRQESQEVPKEVSKEAEASDVG